MTPWGYEHDLSTFTLPPTLSDAVPHLHTLSVHARQVIVMDPLLSSARWAHLASFSLSATRPRYQHWPSMAALPSFLRAHPTLRTLTLPHWHLRDEPDEYTELLPALGESNIQRLGVSLNALGPLTNVDGRPALPMLRAVRFNLVKQDIRWDELARAYPVLESLVFDFTGVSA